MLAGHWVPSEVLGGVPLSSKGCLGHQDCSLYLSSWALCSDFPLLSLLQLLHHLSRGPCTMCQWTAWPCIFGVLLGACWVCMSCAESQRPGGSAAGEQRRQLHAAAGAFLPGLQVAGCILVLSSRVEPGQEYAGAFFIVHSWANKGARWVKVHHTSLVAQIRFPFPTQKAGHGGVHLQSQHRYCEMETRASLGNSQASWESTV